jgi:hypothetical protein
MKEIKKLTQMRSKSAIVEPVTALVRNAFVKPVETTTIK